ncbi:malonate transporter subunit MadM [Endozoicomonadaceae bacterium StTr2]
MILTDAVCEVLAANLLLTAFVVTGSLLWVSYYLAGLVTCIKLHGSAIAITLALSAALVAGLLTGGTKGVGDFRLLAGITLLGSPMFLNLSIVATAYGVRVGELQRIGFAGVVALAAGIILPFIVGALTAYGFGFRDAVSLTTLGAGAATYLVGPVTGEALGASSEVIVLSIAAGLVKSVAVMTATPFVARYIGLDNPRSAIVFGGLLGTTSGVVAGLAATDPKLVPYGAMSATFYTGLGCLLGPSLMYAIIQSVLL